ncbi:cell division protein FtsW [Candidatus Woesebacteria bacterium]|nr:cell division protein FtsW [Candidatus Woesebacteria bacterium]
MKSRPSHSAPFLIFLSLLLAIGLLFVFDSSGPESVVMYGSPYALTLQHILGLAVGLVALLAGIVTPPKLLLKYSRFVYVFGLISLAAVFLPKIGLSLNGAHRWLLLAGVSFQPVEFFKLAVLVYMSSWLSQHQKISGWLLTLVLPAVILLLQPDLGSLIVVLAIASGIYIVAGGQLKQLGIIAAAGIPVLLLLIVIAPYRMQRLTTFLDPDRDPLGTGFHTRQITLALGRGGIFGQGLGNSSQKFSYVPEASTDSIAAIIGEETGFVGLLMLIGLYAAFIIAGYRLIQPAEGSYRLLGLGILIWISVQAMLNIAAVAALVPLTGVPLPFISYGRSSLVMLLYAVGLLLRLGKKQV